MNFNVDIFTKLDKEWALLTAGSLEDHNGMTVSWGGMGTLWGKPVVTVYVRPNRYTYEYMEKNDYFTLSFYERDQLPALRLMGTRSGRDMDKEAAAGLVPVKAGESVSFKQAQVTLVCKKLYHNDLDPDAIPDDVMASCYSPEPIHRMYIGEVVEIIREG